MQRWLPGMLLVALAMAPLGAQAADWRMGPAPAGSELLRTLRLPLTSLDPVPASAPGTLVAGSPGFLATLVDPQVETLATLLATLPPRVSRDDLDGAGETQLRYHGLPGGIVLGLTARPIDSSSGGPLSGATLAGDGERLLLALADGRVLLCPPVEPASLRACLDFVAGGAGSDAVVDIAFGRPRLAPAFAGTPLEERLIALDRVPHRLHPQARAWKSVIVDRDVRCEVRGDELVLSADLEVRFYTDVFTTGVARRVVEPGLSPVPELAPLAEIAAWIGFLRWSAAQDPGGLARLRARTQ